jgi:hypothetical protein
MSYFVVDVESDGPVPALYSMVCFGAVLVEPSLSKTFYGQVKPIADLYLPDALAISGFTRVQHETFPEPKETMEKFRAWISESNGTGRPIFFSDNPAFDWQWINYYFHNFLGDNPFGYSARRIGDIYCGLKKNLSLNQEWKRKYRKQAHTHNPVDDALGNAQALLAFQNLGIKIIF